MKHGRAQTALGRIRRSIESIDVARLDPAEAQRQLEIHQRAAARLVALAGAATFAVDGWSPPANADDEVFAWQRLVKLLEQEHPELPRADQISECRAPVLGENRVVHLSPPERVGAWIEHALAIVDVLLDRLGFNDGRGGDIIFRAGDGGGDITIRAGDARPGANGGSIYVQAGDGGAMKPVTRDSASNPLLAEPTVHPDLKPLFDAVVMVSAWSLEIARHYDELLSRKAQYGLPQPEEWPDSPAIDRARERHAEWRRTTLHEHAQRGESVVVGDFLESRWTKLMREWSGDYRDWCAAIAKAKELAKSPAVAAIMDAGESRPPHRWTTQTIIDLNNLAGTLHPIRTGGVDGLGFIRCELPPLPTDFRTHAQAVDKRIDELKAVPIGDGLIARLAVAPTPPILPDEEHDRLRANLNTPRLLSTMKGEGRGDSTRMLAMNLAGLATACADLRILDVLGDAHGSGGRAAMDTADLLGRVDYTAAAIVLPFRAFLNAIDANALQSSMNSLLGTLRTHYDGAVAGLDHSGAVGMDPQRSITLRAALRNAKRLIDALSLVFSPTAGFDYRKLKADLEACQPRFQAWSDELVAVIEARGVDAARAEHNGEGHKATTTEESNFRCAAWFGKSMAARLRMAARKSRKTKRVATKMIDKVVCYSVSDARQWWPSDVPKEP